MRAKIFSNPYSYETWLEERGNVNVISVVVFNGDLIVTYNFG